MRLGDAQYVRAKNLSQWFDGKTLPVKEKSYISQLINGKSSFGERAARRIEKQYGMPSGFLDSGIESTPQLVLSDNENQLIKIYRRLPQSDKEKIMKELASLDNHYALLFEELTQSRS